MNQNFIKNYTAGAAIAKFRIVKMDSSDYQVIQAAASTDYLFGVSNAIPADAANDRVDVVQAGVAKVELGGTVTRGQMLTSDANGKAVAATMAALVNTIIAGGSAGDHTVTGIATTDTLVSVIEIDGTDASETYADLTSEFSISAADTINNTGGTDTTGSGLIVTYRNPQTGVIGRAVISGVSGDIGEVFIAPSQI